MNTLTGMIGIRGRLIAAVFVIFALTGAALPTLPLHLKGELGQDVFIIGLIAGVQFLAALLSRVWAGSFADRKSPKAAMIVGLCLAIGAGALYLVSIVFIGIPRVSVLVLAFGRAMMGAAECFVIVGAVSWSLRLSGAAQTGNAIAQMGNALYLGLALGAPLGSLLFDRFGFDVIGLCTLVLPLCALLTIFTLPSLAAEAHESGSLMAVLRSVWLPGVGLSFASLGYGAMMSFAILLFVERNWQPAWLAFTIFAIAFIAIRLGFGSLSDRYGGARIAQIFAIAQGAGLALIAFSPWVWLGYLGAAITGVGYSLVYPAFGLEAVNRAPVASKGLAIGTYTAFLELALAITSPLLGLLARWTNLGTVFMISAVAAIGAAYVGSCLKSTSILIANSK
jgi:predicted MFS family arabinose efflux permease